MTKPWEAEQRVDAERARALIHGRFPELAAADVRLLGEGWDNTNFVVDGEWVFRFPRRTVAVPLLATEVAVLPQLADRLPLPIPRPEQVADGGEGYPWPFYGYRMLHGRDAVGAEASAETRMRWARELAGFLAALHGVTGAELEGLCAAGLGPDPIRRLDFATRWPLALERLHSLRSTELALDEERVASLRARVPEGYDPAETHVVQGDLHAAQVLVDGDRLTGVVDWGDVHRGDPACDLALVHGFLSPEEREVFRTAYGAIPHERWEAARLHALAHAIAVAAYALDRGDRRLIADVRRRFANLGVST